MELAKETRERIFSAADALYEQANRANFPTVDAVRKTAKVNMNDASAGMKEWRRAQTAQAAPLAVNVPDAVQQASNAAMAALWQQAQELANESLRAAQAGWEAERAESDTLTKQMADAYEAVAAELDATRDELGRLTASAEQTEIARQSLQAQLIDTSRSLTTATAALERAEARTIEIERRANELRTELDHSHQEAGKVQAELSSVRQAHAVEVEALRAELSGLRQAHVIEVEALRAELAGAKARAEAQAETYQEHRKTAAKEAAARFEELTKVTAERDQAQKDASQAREDAAQLRGQVQAVKEQNAQLMESVKPAQKPAKAGDGTKNN